MGQRAERGLNAKPTRVPVTRLQRDVFEILLNCPQYLIGKRMMT